MLDTKWRPSLDPAAGPLYRALADAICAAVESGAVGSGARLPPVRDLAYELGISPGAVARAYRIATDRGALEATVGRGTFARVGAKPATAFERLVEGARPGLIDLRGNRAVDIGQDAALTAALQRMIDRSGGALPLTDYRYGDGDLGAREAVATWLRAGGVPAQADRLIVTPGAQAGALLCLTAVARGGSGVAIAEATAHPGLKDAAAAAGIRLEAAACDAEGLIPDALDAACARLRPDAVLVTATLHNPTLATMSLGRRAAIAEIAEARGVRIIEDDVYGWLAETRGPSFASLAPKRSWYVTSFSKCVAAGLRAGFVLSPPDMARETARLHQAVLHHTPHLVTGLAEELIASGDADRIRAGVARETAARVALAEAALGRYGARTDPAASFAMVPTPAPWTSAEFAAAAAAAGVQVAPRAIYAVGRADGPDFVRVALGAKVDRAALETGLARLAALLERGPDAFAT